jgi:ribosome-associated protein YbcJ (S4-like RNA binding protein)
MWNQSVVIIIIALEEPFVDLSQLLKPLDHVDQG